MTAPRWLRDWWRGYSDADQERAVLKIAHGDNRPGSMIPLSCAEMRAYVAFYREKLR